MRPARIPLLKAERAAASFIRLIEYSCDRVAVAGSVRLRRPQHTVIDVVAVPTIFDVVDLFGVRTGSRNILDEMLASLTASKRITPTYEAGRRGKAAPWRGTTRRLTFVDDGGTDVPVTLWTTTADRWGVVLAIRTGPPGLASAMETPVGTISHGGRAGLLAPGYWISDGLRERDGGALVPTPEEDDFLRYVDGVPREPELRT